MFKPACRAAAKNPASGERQGLALISKTKGLLSGGEGQRIRLATQIGSKLRGVLYVLDEPSIGLHHRDNGRLLTALENLRDLGNTVLVVEHDEETIRRADYVVDLKKVETVHWRPRKESLRQRLSMQLSSRLSSCPNKTIHR